MKNIFSRTKKEAVEQEQAENSSTVVASAKASHYSFMPSTPLLREEIVSFIIQSLKPYVDEKGMSVAGLKFYILCNSREEEEAASIALYTDRPGLFKTEQLERKLMNHFIQVDPAWFFEWTVIQEKALPADCVRQDRFGLKIVRSGERVANQYAKALIQILAGQATSSEYVLDPCKHLKFYIGRTGTPQLSSGKIQQNDIVFIGKDEEGFNEATGGPNLHVSRNHAYIFYDARTNNYFLYPDKGGLPENGNKLKVHTGDDKVKWLNIYGVPYCLCDGDQVELGGAAVFRFRTM